MGIIRLDKKYEKLYVVGCSFTTGHHQGKLGSWGTYLAERLNCECQISAAESSSNYAIISHVVNLCETNDMSNSCVGIQFSERSRREIWSSEANHYDTFNVATIETNSEEYLSKNLKFIKKHLEFFDDIWFDDKENLIRTTISMLLIRGYLESKNIDYIMFEGISTISDNLTVNKPKNANVYYGFDKLIDKNFSSQVLDDKTFFNKYGPMQPFNRTHPLYDVDINLGHPNSEFVKWWADEMYNHIKDNQ